jgi:hypothetical protein
VTVPPSANRSVVVSVGVVRGVGSLDTAFSASGGPCKLRYPRVADKHDCTQTAYELVCRALISLNIYGWPVGLAVCGKLLWGHSSPSADVASDCVAALLIQRRLLWLVKWMGRWGTCLLAGSSFMDTASSTNQNSPLSLSTSSFI